MTALDVTFDHRISAESGAKRATEIVVEPEEHESGDSETGERHFALCIDTSGSMRWQVDPSTPEETTKLEKVKNGLETALSGQLKHDDYVSVVTFSSEAETVVPIESWGEANEDAFWNKVQNLEPGGKTDIFGALEHAHEELRKAGDRDAVRRILLLTDGQHKPDGGTDRDPDFEQLASDIDESQVSIMAAGVGSDYDRHLMKTLADASQGNSHHLETEDDFAEFVRDELGRMSDVGTVAPELEIELNPQFTANDFYRRVGGEAQPGDVNWGDSGTTAVVSLGDLVEGEAQMVTFDLGIPARPDMAGETCTAADIGLRQGGKTLTHTEIEVEFIPILKEEHEDEKGHEGDEDVEIITTSKNSLRNEYRAKIKRAEGESEFDEIEDGVEDEVKGEHPELFEELSELLEDARGDDDGILEDKLGLPDAKSTDDD